MGLIAWAQQRAHVWTWRARYWWLDTREGRVANILVCVLLALASLVALVRSVALGLIAPPPPDAPASAIAPFVVQIIIAIVCALIAYALAPKPEPPPVREGEGPQVEDGLAVLEVYGTCWIDEEFFLAWKVVGRDDIKTKGGKK